MPHKLNRKANGPIAATPDSLQIDQASGHKKSKRNQPRPDQLSNTERPTPTTTSSKRGGRHTSRSISSDDDADGDVSNGDDAEPDDESDEDRQGDAFAPSDRAIEEYGDQAGHISGDVFDRESTYIGKQSNGPTILKGMNGVTEERLTVGDSDDDFYNRVDLISDSEQDERSVEQLEEQNIIESEEANESNTAAASFEASDGWEGFELEDAPFFDEQHGRTNSSILDSELELFQPANIFGEVPSPSLPSPSPRRVRFKEPISQSSHGSDMNSDNEEIKVLFNPVSTCVVPSRGEFDLGGPYLDGLGDDSSSVGSSSGYETDYGDTTDEEDVPASATKRPQSLLRQPSLSSLELDAQNFLTPTPKAPSGFPGDPAGYRRGPRMGTWTIDSTKACAVVDGTGETMIIHHAARPFKPNNSSVPTANSITGTADASPIVSHQDFATALDDNGNDPGALSAQASMYGYLNPVLGQGSEMVAAPTPLSVRQSRQPLMDSPFADPFFFFPLMDGMEDVFKSDYLNGEDDDEDDELLNIDDFIDFGDDSSEDGDQTAGDDSVHTSPTATDGPGAVQLKTPSPDATMASDNLMKHLDKHVVSAFRRGQVHHQPLSLPAQRPRQGNLALNSYALKGGRQAAANAQTGPQKKRKMSGSFGHRPSFGVPTAKRRMIRHR